jgi:hypothetical protein
MKFINPNIVVMRIVMLLLFTAAIVQLSFGQRITIAAKPDWAINVGYDLSVPPAKELSEGSALVLFDMQTNLTESAVYHHVVRKLVNETGVQNNSQLEIQFDPTFQKVVFHHITIHRNGINIEVADARKFNIIQQEKGLPNFNFNGKYTALFLLDDIRSGDMIDYAYTIRGFNPVFGNRYFSKFYFQGSEPISNIHVSILIPDNRKLNTVSYNNAPQAIIKKNLYGNFTGYSWEARNVKSRFIEKDEPVWFDPLPHVQVSEMNSWSEVVNWGLEINPDFTKSATAVETVTHELGIEATDKTEYLKKCIRFVQDEIRYMSIATDVNSHKPHEPSQVLSRRYGDCKDKSILLCALLHRKGIEAYPAYINTDLRHQTSNQLPSPVVFDHCVTVVFNEGQLLWIDPTLSLQRGPVEKLSFPDYREGLIIKPGEIELTQIPNQSIGKMRVEESFWLQQPGEEGFLSVRTVYTGYEADNVRSFFQNNSLDYIEQSYLDYYSNLYDSVTLESHLAFYDDDEINELIVEESYRVPGIWVEEKQGSEKFQFNARANILRNNITFISGSNRKAPVVLKYPFNLEYDIRIDLPEQWNIKAEVAEVNDSTFKFDYEVSKIPSGLIISYKYNSLKNEVSVAEIPVYNKNIDLLMQNLDYQVTWNKGLANKGNTTGSEVRIINVIIGLLFFVLFSMVAFWYYKRNLVTVTVNLPRDFGGWLILPMIGLIITPFLIIHNLITNNYFSEHLFDQIRALEVSSSSTIEALMIGEMMGNILMLVMCLLCLVSFFKKRDITPRLMIAFYLFNAAFLIIDDVMVEMILGDIVELESSTKEIGRAIIACAIWIPYFMNSKRVKETFIMPFHSIPPEMSTILLNDETINTDESELSKTGSEINENSKT